MVNGVCLIGVLDYWRDEVFWEMNYGRGVSRCQLALGSGVTTYFVYTSKSRGVDVVLVL
jgi:hypothetical protein